MTTYTVPAQLLQAIAEILKRLPYENVSVVLDQMKTLVADAPKAD